jgi:tellurite resistance protein TerA
MPIDYSKKPSEPEGNAPVSLTKAAPVVSLTKRGGATGRLHVNLNWQSGAVKKGLFGKSSGGIDLDLAALFELTDGSKGAVQALGNAFGSLDAPPYVYLDGDDRSGSAVGGENLYINLAHSAQIKRVLIFAFIYEGTASFDAAQAAVTITPATGSPITVHLDEAAGNKRMCAIALLTNEGGDLKVQREVNFIDGMQRKLDEAYSWGMPWKAGHK